MDALFWRRAKDVLDQILDAPATRRDALLHELCNGDRLLRDEVASLLAAHRQAATFLSHPVADEMEDPFLGRSLGPYRLAARIGAGGMGVVYRAEREDGAFRQEVAVKIMRRGLDAERMVAGFLHERQILAGLNHPHIARLYDGGATEEGLPYLVMELVAGEPIREYCRRRRLNIRQRLGLLRKVCEAVHYAHRNLVVHRDIKPGNILVDHDGEPKLLDFGIARLLQPRRDDEPTSAFGLAAMTPEYASPEQIRGELATTASDIYSLGVLAFELLTGVRPYGISDRSEDSLRRAICQAPPARPRAAARAAGETAPAGTIDRDMEKILLMALRKEPERRYASAQQFAEDIDRCLTGFPVVAATDGFGYAAWKFITRHRGATAAALAALLLTAVYLASAWLQRRQTIRQYARAERLALFMKDLFQVHDPYRADPIVNPKVTARELLDRATRQIDRAFADDPAVKADLLLAMGEAYIGLGHYDRAGEALQTAVALRARRFGETDPETQKAVAAKAKLALARRNLDEADALFQAAAPAFQGESSAGAAEWLRGRAATAHHRYRYEQAERFYREALATLERAGMAEAPLAAMILNDLGHAYYKQDKYADAERAHRQALSLEETAFGREHGLNASILDNLGIVLRQVGRLEEAKDTFQRSLAIRETVLDENSLEIADSCNNLGLTHIRLWRHDLAEPVLRRALAIRQAVLGDHPLVGNAHNNLAMLYKQTDQYDAAAFHHGRAIHIRAKQGGMSVHLGASYNNLANLLFEMGSFAQSEEYSLCALDQFETLLGPDHSHVAHPIKNLAKIAAEEGDWERAERLDLRVLAIRARALGDTHPAVADALIQYAGHLRARARTLPPEAAQASLVQAEAAISEAYAQRLAVYGPDHRAVADALERLAEALRDLGMNDMAAGVEAEAAGVQGSLDTASL